MKHRTTVSIFICILFLAVSSLLFALDEHLNTGMHPGLHTASFAPATVIRVSDSEDIVVKVYPVCGIPMHASEKSSGYEVKLNNITEGWLVAQYQGNCRLLFDIKDADMEDFYEFLPYEHHYYYAEIIPEQRISVTDITARLGDEPTDPFAADKLPMYQDCCVAEEIHEYSYPRKIALRYLIADAVFILLVVTGNVVISIKHRRKG